MKQLIAMLCCYLIAHTVDAQTKINKTIAADGISTAELNFEYADVTIKTWDKNEIQITGTVNINSGQDDDAFDMDIKDRNGKLSISTSVDTESLNFNIKSRKKTKTITINEDDTVYYGSYSNSNKIENTLVIMLPKDIVLKSSSIYGGTIIEGFTKSIKIDNTYGPVDAISKDISDVNLINIRSIYAPVDISLPSTAKADLELNTEYGSIYSDMDMEINVTRDISKKLFGERIQSTLNGGGIRIKLESNYSKIYIRES